MKRKSITCALVLLCSCALVSGVAMAQEENAGFIKKMWRKIIQKDEKADKKPQPAKQKKPVKPQPMRREAPPKPVVRTEPRKLTKEEKLEVVSNNLEIYGDEITSKIPQLVKKVDEKGVISYMFKKESGELVDIKDLDEEALSPLCSRVMNEAVLLRTERLNRQLEQIRQAQQAARPPQIPRAVTQPPRPPTIPTPPRIHTVTPPPQVPRGQRR